MASLPPNFLDELRARTPLAALIGRSVRLTRSGREQKGCCPFHNEKTPSFYVYDDHFHCFGCGEHGDAITFVMKSTGAGFMEAVEQLAGEAGMAVPRTDPQALEAERKRAGINEVLAAAADVYHNWLFGADGAPALAYLRGRGLTDATIRKFRLGWSGEGRGALASALARQGITTDQLVEAGLMKAGERGPVDMFFSRVMFPIFDRRGRAISFGGRILGDGQPKYVNGPETPAFSKRRSLYGLHLAREAVRGGQALIVVEGYMDVIALAQAGFFGAVAPLGTALTDDHLNEIWRLSPEPVICFDADAAGRRAALRTVDLALTALSPDRSLKFLKLPEGEDPDSLVRREGAAGFSARLARAEPLSTALYDMLAEGVVITTPEAKADFRKRLTEAAGRIPDKILASEYRNMLLDRFFAARRQNGARGNPGLPPRAGVRADPASITPERSDQARALVLTSLVLRYPAIFTDIEELYADVPLPDTCTKIRAGLHDFAAGAAALDTDMLLSHLTGSGLERDARLVLALAERHYRVPPELTRDKALKLFGIWHGSMNSRVNVLRLQHKQCKDDWVANPTDYKIYQRYVKSVEELRKFEAGVDSSEF